MRFATSGNLEVADVSSDTGVDGLLQVTLPWWIETGVSGWAFELEDAAGRVVVRLEEAGRLWLLPGFVYDGSSGPTADVDGLDEVPAALHDAGYRAVRARKLPWPEARKPLDEFYRDLLAERGMSPYWHPVRPKPWWKVWHLLNPGYKTRYLGLRLFAGYAAQPVDGPVYAKRTAA